MVAVCRATEGVSSAVDSCYKYMIIIVNCIIVLVLYEYFPRVRALGITRSVFVLLHAQAIGVYPAQLILYHFVQMCHSSEARIAACRKHVGTDPVLACFYQAERQLTQLMVVCCCAPYATVYTSVTVISGNMIAHWLLSFNHFAFTCLQS